MDATGFATILTSRFSITSRTPCGAALDAAVSVSFNVCGKIKLDAVAINAARKVLAIYNTITVLILAPAPPLEFARELITSTNTSTGATARRAPTNMVPNQDTIVNCGTASPRTAPTAIPITILKIKLILHHFSKSFFIILPPYPYILFGKSSAMTH